MHKLLIIINLEDEILWDTCMPHRRPQFDENSVVYHTTQIKSFSKVHQSILMFFCVKNIFFIPVIVPASFVHSVIAEHREAYFNGSSYLRLQTPMPMWRHSAFSIRSCRGIYRFLFNAFLRLSILHTYFQFQCQFRWMLQWYK